MVIRHRGLQGFLVVSTMDPLGELRLCRGGQSGCPCLPCGLSVARRTYLHRMAVNPPACRRNATKSIPVSVRSCPCSAAHSAQVWTRSIRSACTGSVTSQALAKFVEDCALVSFCDGRCAVALQQRFYGRRFGLLDLRNQHINAESDIRGLHALS